MVRPHYTVFNYCVDAHQPPLRITFPSMLPLPELELDPDPEPNNLLIALHLPPRRVSKDTLPLRGGFPEDPFSIEAGRLVEGAVLAEYFDDMLFRLILEFCAEGGLEGGGVLAAVPAVPTEILDDIMPTLAIDDEPLTSENAVVDKLAVGVWI